MFKDCIKCQNVKSQSEGYRCREYCSVTKSTIYPNTRVLCSYYIEKPREQLEMEDYKGW